MQTRDYFRMIARARKAHDSAHPRASYADDVIAGHRAWSGRDIKGKARRYGGHYARQRANAARFIRDAGGMLAYVGPRGECLAAVYVGADDYGRAVFQTMRGAAIAERGVRLTIV